MKWLFTAVLILLVSCAQAGTMDIATAMKLGKPIKCVSSQADQTSTIYMKGSKMRMDTMPADAHGIYTEDMVYSWQGSQGMMMKMSDVKQMVADAGQQYKAPSQEEVVERAKATDARCEPVEADESMFMPPSDVQFEDVGKMMQGARGMQK